MQERKVFAKENWQDKNWLRQLNRERIDAGKALVLKIICYFFDRPLKSYQEKQKFNPAKIKKILIFHFDDKIGDLVINSIMFRELKKLGDSISIDIVTGKNSMELIRNHPLLHRIYVFRKGFFRTIFFALQLRSKKYDLVIDPRIQTDARTIYLLSQIQPQWVIGLQKRNFQIYSDSIEENWHQRHMSLKIQAILEKLGLQNNDLHYALAPSLESQQNFEKIQKKYSLQKYIVLNLFAGARFRSFRPETGIRIVKLIRKLNLNNPIVLVGPPAKALEIESVIASLPTQNLHYFPSLRKISDVAEIIRQANLVITPDTSLVHIASAFNVPLIAVYYQDSVHEEKNSVQWAPKSSFAQVIFAHGRTDGEVDVNSFSEEQMKQALHSAIITHQTLDSCVK